MESIAFLVILIAWLLRAILTPLMKRRQRSPGGPKPAGGQPQQPPPRSAAELLKELGLDLGEPEPEPRTPVEEVRRPSPLPLPASMPPPPVAARRASSIARGTQRKSKVLAKEALLPPLELPSLAVVPSAGGKRNPVRDKVLKELRGGPPSLRSAIVLAEVLGPPAGLRSDPRRPRR